MKLQVATEAKLPLCEFSSTDSPQRGNAAPAGRSWWLVWGVLALLIVGNGFMAIKLFSLSQEIKSIENQVVSSRPSYADSVANEIDVEYERELAAEDNNELQLTKLRTKRSSSKRRPVCHLVGIGQDGQRHHGEFFSWARPDVRNSPPISTCHMNVSPHRRDGYVKSINISRSGLYYVYAQVTFRTGGAQNSAIQIVRTDDGTNTTLMTSVVKQQTSSYTVVDSVSVGGVFFLQSMQTLTVKDVKFTVRTSNTDQRPDYSYFGVVFLSKK